MMSATCKYCVVVNFMLFSFLALLHLTSQGKIPSLLDVSSYSGYSIKNFLNIVSSPVFSILRVGRKLVAVWHKGRPLIYICKTRLVIY